MEMNSPAAARAIIERISARPRLAPERMPVLNAIMERLAVSGSDFLRKLCGPQMAMEINALGIGVSSELLAVDQDSLAAVFVVPEWDSAVLIGIDRHFIHAIMELAFGGDGVEPAPSASQPFSALDIRMSRKLLDHMASCIADFFQPVSKISLMFERTEVRLNAQTLGPKPYDVVVARFGVQAFGEDGGLFIYLPAASLSQFRSQFERTVSANQAPDPSWTRQLEVELGQSQVRVEAVLAEFQMTLADISRLHAGQLIDLGVAPGSPVVLEGADEHLFSCRLGQTNRMFVLTIEDTVADQRDLWQQTGTIEQ